MLSHFWLLANSPQSVTHGFSRSGVARLYMPRLEYMKRSPRSRQPSTQSVFEAVYRPYSSSHEAERKYEWFSSAGQLFGMFNFIIHGIIFQLRLMNKKKERRWRKSKFLCLVFSTLLKLSGTFGVDLALELLKKEGCKLFALLCFFFWEMLLYLMYSRPFWTCPIPN